MPSGVTTAIPRCTPDVVPRSTNTTFEFEPGAGGDDGGGNRLGLGVLLEHLQGLGAVGGVQFVLEEDVLHLHAIEFGAQAEIFLVGIVQQNVVVQEAGAAAAQALDNAGHRCDGGYRPDADKAHILVVLP